MRKQKHDLGNQKRIKNKFEALERQRLAYATQEKRKSKKDDH